MARVTISIVLTHRQAITLEDLLSRCPMTLVEVESLSPVLHRLRHDIAANAPAKRQSKLACEEDRST